VSAGGGGVNVESPGSDGEVDAALTERQNEYRGEL